MTFLRDTLTALAVRPWAVILLFILTCLGFGLLSAMERQFEDVVGVPVFDTQKNLTVEQLLEQLPVYQEASNQMIYLQVVAVDTIIPLLSVVFVATFWTLLLRTNTSLVAHLLLTRGFALLILPGAVWDWLENLSFLAALNLPAQPSWLLSVIIVFNQLKTLWIVLIIPITALLLFLLLGNRLLGERPAPTQITQF